MCECRTCGPWNFNRARVSAFYPPRGPPEPPYDNHCGRTLPPRSSYSVCLSVDCCNCKTTGALAVSQWFPRGCLNSFPCFAVHNLGRNLVNTINLYRHYIALGLGICSSSPGVLFGVLWGIDCNFITLITASWTTTTMVSNP